jgi:hypothetical protein
MRAFVLVLLALGSACEATRTTPAEAPPPVASAPVPAPAPDPCGAPLLVQRNAEGRPSRAYLPAVVDGADVLIWIDTGSPKSHLTHGLTGPAIGPDKTIRFADQTRSWPTWRNRFQPPFAGRNVVGTLGADEVLAQTTELDLARGCLTMYPSGTIPAHARAWPTVLVDRVAGTVVSAITVDDRPFRVLVDTGVDETIVITDAVPRTGQRFVVQDVYGLDVVLIRGTATLRWQSLAPWVVTLDRTTAFPTFDRLGLGADVRGMLGLNSIGSRRIVFDAAGGRIFVEPK